MDVRDLEYLVAVGETQHFGRAAERLGVRAEDLTRWSHEIEKATGLPLFERTVRRVRLTASGARVESEALRALTAVRAVDSVAKALREGWSGQVGLGYVPGAAHLAAALRAKVEQDRAGLEVVATPMWGLRALAALDRSDVDLALVRDPLPEEGVESLLLGCHRDSQVAVPSPGPLSGKTRLPLREFEAQGFLLPERDVSPSVHDATVRFLAENGVAPVWKHHRLMEQDQQLAMVAAGVGVALVHPDVSHPGVAVVPLVEKGPEHRFHLLWRANDTSPLVTAAITAATALVGVR
ncbi:LysR substrate-binding domain-containing protein [Actinokineospora pegani]|uniref:LysR substrate-binding domain-containing protein n=1 Tax=Actinokineospora pegani TaxID=2654637 RepID=UPI0018D2B812|nr:LysR substrate-binding domain-containing protein [Actinokineospora pegani]